MFDRIPDLKASKTIEISKLLALSNGDPATFFDGANLDGVDLRGQDLRGISLERADITGVFADAQTLTDDLDFKRKLLYATMATHRKMIREASERNSKVLGKSIIEFSAVALYLREQKEATAVLSKINQENIPDSIIPIIRQSGQYANREIARVISIWLELRALDQTAFQTYLILSEFNLNVSWLKQATDWIIFWRTSKQSLRLAKKIASGDHRSEFLKEIEYRLISQNTQSDEIAFWLTRTEDAIDSDLYFKAMYIIINNGWLDKSPHTSRVSLFSKYILSYYGQRASELINSYADPQKRTDWIVALSRSIEAATQYSQFGSIQAVARRLDVSLPPLHARGSTSADRRRFVDAALAQIGRIEPQLAATVKRRRKQVKVNIENIGPSALPQRSDLYVATVNVLKQFSNGATIVDIEEGVAEELSIDPRARTIRHGNDHRTKLQYELAWVRTYLKWADALENIERGVWRLTEIGKRMSDGDLKGLWREVSARQRKAKQNSI